MARSEAPRPDSKPKRKAATTTNRQRPRGTLTVANVAAALRSSAGIRSEAARKLKVTSPAITQFIHKHPEINDIIAEIEEGLLDLSESKLVGCIQRSEFPAIKFYLERKGRHRGYASRYEVTGANGGPIELKDLSGFSDEQLAILERAALVLAGGAGGTDGEPVADADEHSEGAGEAGAQGD